jgi:hypothetical protein
MGVHGSWGVLIEVLTDIFLEGPREITKYVRIADARAEIKSKQKSRALPLL